LVDFTPAGAFPPWAIEPQATTDLFSSKAAHALSVEYNDFTSLNPAGRAEYEEVYQ
jgi:hypothetical protein